ncbi:hypothetical protein GQ600_10930 [Phytophthora cactorum]|nr:hypothetical protein GQ600_10930 [Phytophthora cactorum]
MSFEKASESLLAWGSGFEIPSEVVAKPPKMGICRGKVSMGTRSRTCIPHEVNQVELNGRPTKDSVPVMPEGWKGPGHFVSWGGHAILEALRKEHHDVAKWLYDNTPHLSDAEEKNNICEVAVNVGNFDLARRLLPLDKSIAEYVCHWAKVEVVEQLLESTDILKKHQDFAAFVISKIAYKGNLCLI